MTLTPTGQTEDAVQNVRDRSLAEAYELHDVGEALLCRRLRRAGFIPVQFGDDARHADTILLGDGPDIACYNAFDEDRSLRPGASQFGSDATHMDDEKQRDPIDWSKPRAAENAPDGSPDGYIEIKTKSSPDWMYHCNRRHFNDYVEAADELDAPVVIWWALIAEDTEDPFIQSDGAIEVQSTRQVERDCRSINDETLVVKPDDIEPLRADGGDGTTGYCTVDGSDVVEVSNDERIVKTIPEVHGNEVIQLNPMDARSLEWVYRRFRGDKTLL